MSKLFFDVFKDLSIESTIRPVLDDAVIERIAENRSGTSMRLYLTLKTIVPKNNIKNLEKKISDQYFHKTVNVNIVERFEIDSPVRPEDFYEKYRDSMLLELYSSDRVLYQLFKDTEITFPSDEKAVVSLPSKSAGEFYEDRLNEYLINVFEKRGGEQVSFDFEYHAPKKDFLEENEKIINDWAEKIFMTAQNNAMMKNENSASDTAASNENTAVKTQNEGGKAGQGAASPQTLAKAPEPPKRDFLRKDHTSFSNTKYRRTPRKSSSPDCIRGIDLPDEITPISEISEESGFVVIRGKIFKVDDPKTLKSGKTLYKFAMTDGTDSIYIKCFLTEEENDAVQKCLQKGAFVKVGGNPEIDTFDHDLNITNPRGIFKSTDFRVKREDHSPEKRVELHLHTNMSDSDGISDIADIVKQAKAFGHRALAVTDHGVVQAFPDANNIAHDVGDFKIIYGMEAYLVDDTRELVTDSKGQSLDGDFVVFDLESTGLNSKECKIIEIGAVFVRNGEIIDRFSEFVNPEEILPFRIVELTGIRDTDLKDADTIDVILPKFRAFCGDAVLVAHNALFDTGCIKAECEREGIDWDFTFADTMTIASYLRPDMAHFKLEQVAKAFDVELIDHHRAVNDAECTAGIFIKQIEELKALGINDLDALNREGMPDDERRKKLRPYHAIILAKNDVGRINLYRLVSLSHLKYFSRFPKVPKSVLQKYREGLIIGSACEAGELYQAILLGRSDEELYRIASFYDYFEIQPIGNNKFLLKDEKSGINSEDDLREINRKIVSLGDELGKLTVATSDAHFLNPEDAIYRTIIQASKDFKDAADQPPIYFHTTDEMLEEFSYLGEEKCYDVVIKNTNLICDMCDEIKPTRPDKCPPVIENSDGMLRKICENRAHQIYGEELPPLVNARLERELNSIIGNGYAVMYIIAQKLVWKSVEDGYLVGSRGSVGSSFVATMAGITEVNPLPPHYLCHHCHYVDFDSEDVKKFAGMSGSDMPDKKCPVCGADLDKMGFDIPFETFLGFKGNKEPDIDLNFSSEYQNKAHKYTEVIFGAGQTFKAGTIETVADKTAYGYAKHYFEDNGITKRSCEIERVSSGCIGVRRSTGQHPGGIVVLPNGEDINTFTPVQHPANKDTDIVTTHFDYHKIDANLLKLDILGHDDPTMIRYLEDLTGLDVTEIPLDDPAVMSLFKDTSAMGIPDGALYNTNMGTLGIPEFGTDNAMGMLKEAKPKNFSDLIRISGLSHGTDVWRGNAEDLIMNGICDISSAICTRDDIMTYLIEKGMDNEESFKIMEAVRKGKVAKGKCKEWPDYKKDMKEHDVPDWYIGSCEKIQYMFPKAHAVAYVMMAWRIAYCKVYYPLAYYAAYFSIRAKGFDYEKICQGEEALEMNMDELINQQKELKKTNKALSAGDKDLLYAERMAQEFYVRGFEFLPIDLYNSDSKYFKVVDGKLLPPFSVLSGVGEQAAESLMVAAAQGRFMSKDDLKARGKITDNNIALMEKLHIIEHMPQSAQLSIFDMI